MGSREEILAKIGASGGDAASDWGKIERRYVQGATRSREAILELLEDRLRDYDARVFRVADSGLKVKVEELLRERGKRKMLIPEGFVAGWAPEGVEISDGIGLDAAGLDLFEGVVTSSTLAIAETGTICLQGGGGEGRRARSLVPDYHLCVVLEEDVVETVAEGVRRLNPRLATTLFSGPSATADIEMTRIKGVHGPRFLDVILVAAR